jgi:cell filamentation protein
VAGRDSYHDENGVLYNKLGITDSQKLSDVEYLITAARAESWERTPHPDLKYDFERQKAIHHHLFEPIYEWAGKPRTTPLSKRFPNTKLVSIFQEPEAIESGWRDLVGPIDAFLRGDAKSFLAKREQLVDIYVTANSLHPFTEGNGRSLQIFMRDLARTQGLMIDYAKVKKDEWNRASALSGKLARRFEGNFYSYPSDRTRIASVYQQIVSPAAEQVAKAQQPFVMTEEQRRQFDAIALETPADARTPAAGVDQRKEDPLLPGGADRPLQDGSLGGQYTGIIESVREGLVWQRLSDGRVVTHSLALRRGGDDYLLRPGRVVSILSSGDWWNVIDPNVQTVGRGHTKGPDRQR